MTPTRQKKIEQVLSKRQPDLVVVIENVEDPHNVGAILRSCDAFGVVDVHLLYTKFPPPHLYEIRSKSAASASKWLRLTKWTELEPLVEKLHEKGCKIVVTHLAAKAKDPHAVDLSGSVALVIGNEHEGVTEEMRKAADANVRLPMVGFVQSFNVSVAAALLLYEAYRQREEKGKYDEPQMVEEETGKLFKEFVRE